MVKKCKFPIDYDSDCDKEDCTEPSHVRWASLTAASEGKVKRSLFASPTQQKGRKRLKVHRSKGPA